MKRTRQITRGETRKTRGNNWRTRRASLSRLVRCASLDVPLSVTWASLGKPKTIVAGLSSPDGSLSQLSVVGPFIRSVKIVSKNSIEPILLTLVQDQDLSLVLRVVVVIVERRR